jgi:hypothetical protein
LIGAQEAAPKSTKNAEVPEIEVSEETYAESILPINPHSCPDEQMVLAVRWNVASDQLVFCQDGIVLTATQLDPTKRNVVSLRSVGISLSCHNIYTSRTLMRELCKVKLGWDEPLEGELLNKWKGQVNDLKTNQPIMVPRCSFCGVRDETPNY